MSVKGFGIQFEYTTDEGTTWVVVGAVEDATPVSISKDTYETTHHATANGHKTFEGGLVEIGEASVVVQYDPTDTTHLELRSRALTAHESPQAYRFTYADTGATVESFSAICTGFESSTPVDNKMTATITFKPSGTPTLA